MTDDSGREPLSDPPCGLYGSISASLPSLVDTLAHHLTAQLWELSITVGIMESNIIDNVFFQVQLYESICVYEVDC